MFRPGPAGPWGLRCRRALRDPGGRWALRGLRCRWALRDLGGRWALRGLRCRWALRGRSRRLDLRDRLAGRAALRPNRRARRSARRREHSSALRASPSSGRPLPAGTAHRPGRLCRRDRIQAVVAQRVIARFGPAESQTRDHEWRVAGICDRHQLLGTRRSERRLREGQCRRADRRRRGGMGDRHRGRTAGRGTGAADAGGRHGT